MLTVLSPFRWLAQSPDGVLWVDNTVLNSGTGGDTVASDDIAGIKHQRVKLSVGADGAASDAVPVSNGMDVTGAAVQAVGLVAQLDDTASSAVTQNQFAALRLSSRRALLVEGVASGTAVVTSPGSPPSASIFAGANNGTADQAATDITGATGIGLQAVHIWDISPADLVQPVP